MSDEFLTVPEVAERLRMTAMTIYRWIEDGKLPAVQIGKHYRIRATDVDAVLDSSRVRGREDPWSAQLPSRPSVEE
ncbi:MAG: helix-turn-helix domain-containing protein [Solirubrobacteraceae bacterium]